MIRQTVLQALALVALGCGLGAFNKSINPKAPNWVGYYPTSSATDTAKVPESASPDDPPFISIGEAADFFNRPGALFVDARDEYDYKAGFIRGAVNVPFEGDPAIKDAFVAATAKEREIVVYCGGADCDLSLYLGRTLKAAGFTNLHIFFGGWSDWQLQKMPTDSISGVMSGDSTDGGIK